MTSKRANDVDDYMGSRLELRRLMLKESQGGLEKKLGMSFQQIQKYEKDTNRIDAGRLFEIA